MSTRTSSPPNDSVSRSGMRSASPDVMAWDTERPTTTRGGRRTIVSCWVAAIGARDRGARAAQFAHATRALRTGLRETSAGACRCENRAEWEGLFALTPDSLPYIGPHQRYPGHLFALGYGGNGMTFGFLAGRILLEHWRGIRSPDHALFRFGRFS